MSTLSSSVSSIILFFDRVLRDTAAVVRGKVDRSSALNRVQAPSSQRFACLGQGWNLEDAIMGMPTWARAFIILVSLAVTAIPTGVMVFCLLFGMAVSFAVGVRRGVAIIVKHLCLLSLVCLIVFVSWLLTPSPPSQIPPLPSP